MIALNIVLMTLLVVALGCALAWAIVSDRHSKRATGGRVHPSDAPLHRDLVLPREMRKPAATQTQTQPKRRSQSLA
jgi:hypothetical protein